MMILGHKKGALPTPSTMCEKPLKPEQNNQDTSRIGLDGAG